MQILCVDDDPMNRRVVKDMLDVADIRMIEATNGESGLAAINATDFDLVLMNLRMPGMDGLTVIRHVRARTDDKSKLPVIVVTADDAPYLRERCIEAGADDVIPKPVAMDALFDAIARLAVREGNAII